MHALIGRGRYSDFAHEGDMTSTKGWLAVVSGHDFFCMRCTPRAKGNELGASPRGKKWQTHCWSSRPQLRAWQPVNRASRRAPPAVRSWQPEDRNVRATASSRGLRTRHVKAPFASQPTRKSPEAQCAI